MDFDSAPRRPVVEPCLPDDARRGESDSLSHSFLCVCEAFLMLPRGHQLSDHRAMNRVFRNGKKVYGSLFSFVFLENALPQSRFGFVAGKKLAPRAIDRNRTKRLMREAVRPFLPILPSGIDGTFVLIRKPEKPLDLRITIAEIETLLTRARLLSERVKKASN